MEHVVDTNGTQIVVGAKVDCGVDAEGRKLFGRVKAINDADGDVDDEGRAYGINPGVEVEGEDWADTLTTTCTTSAAALYYEDADPEWLCEDALVVAE